LRRAVGSKPGLLGLGSLLGGLVFGYFPAGHRVLSILKQNLLVGVSGKITLAHLFQNSGPVEEGGLIFWLQTETLIEVVKGHL
jgi:hypothetical protein